MGVRRMVVVLSVFPLSQAQSLSSCVLPAAIARPKMVRQDCVNKASPTHYVLSLTWSPRFCATSIGTDADTRFQCVQNRFGFAVHGLWAQSRGARDKCDQPRNCAIGLVSDSLVKTHLCTMPGVQLIQSQWQKHGTCSGLSQPQWFSVIDSLWEGLSLPDPRKMAGAGGTISVKALRDSVARRNGARGMVSGGVMVGAHDGHLEELRLCYDTSFKPAACPLGTGISTGRVRVAR